MQRDPQSPRFTRSRAPLAGASQFPNSLKVARASRPCQKRGYTTRRAPPIPQAAWAISPVQFSGLVRWWCHNTVLRLQHDPKKPKAAGRAPSRPRCRVPASPTQTAASSSFMSLPAPLAARLGSAGIPPGLQNAAWDACAAFFSALARASAEFPRPARGARRLTFFSSATRCISRGPRGGLTRVREFPMRCRNNFSESRHAQRIPVLVPRITKKFSRDAVDEPKKRAWKSRSGEMKRRRESVGVIRWQGLRWHVC